MYYPLLYHCIHNCNRLKCHNSHAIYILKGYICPLCFTFWNMLAWEEKVRCNFVFEASVLLYQIICNLGYLKSCILIWLLLSELTSVSYFYFLPLYIRLSSLIMLEIFNELMCVLGNDFYFRLKAKIEKWCVLDKVAEIWLEKSKIWIC